MASTSLPTNESLGTMGEAMLQLWSAEVDHVLNPSTVDSAGWDGYLESPVRAAETLLRSFGHSDVFPLRARIQVKARQLLDSQGQTKPIIRSIRGVTLRNWIRLVECPEPAFFFVPEFEGVKLKNAYLVHVGEDQIRDILKRHRAHQLSNSDRKTNEITVNVPYKEALPIRPHGGRAFVDTLTQVVRSVGTDYIAWKNWTKTTAGFERGNAVGVITLPSGQPVTLRDIARVEVGLDDALRFQELALHPFRFGLADPEPLHTITNDQLTAPPPAPSAHAEVTIRAPALGASVTVRGDVYTSPTAARIAHQSQDCRVLNGTPVRIQCGRVRLVGDVGAATLDVSFETPADGQDSIPLRELRDMVAAMAVVRLGADAQTPVEFEVTIGGTARFAARADTPSAAGFDDEGFLPFADLVEAVWRVARAFDSDEATPSTTDEIQNQARQFEVLDAAFHGKHLPVTLMSHVPVQSRATVQTFDGDLAAFVCGVRLGDRRAFAAIQVGHVKVGPGAAILDATTDRPRSLYSETAPVSSPARDLREVARFAATQAGETVAVVDETHIARFVVSDAS